MNRCSTIAAIAAVLVIVTGTATGPPVQAQELEQSVFVSVIRRGAPVLDLTVDEFIVEEDGRRREVLRVEPAGVPMQVAILVDDSRAFGRNLSHIRNGLADLIDGLPAGQQISLLTFGDHLTRVIDFTTDKELLKAAAAQFAPFSETSSYLLNAVAEVAIDMDRRGAIRPIVVLMTMEGANANMARVRIDRYQQDAAISPRGGQGLDHRQVLDVLSERLVAVHSLVIRGFGSLGTPDFERVSGLSSDTRGALQLDSGSRDRASLLEQLPKVTGGSREELGTTSAVPEMLARIANDISNQYLVTYARPLGLIPPEEIEVKVTRRRHQVRSTPSRPIMVR